MRILRTPCLVAALALAVTPVLAAEKAAPKKEAVRERSEEAEPQDDSGLGRLYRTSPESVRKWLGDPDVARAEGKGAFWTYRLPHCALFLFFHETPKGLRVTSASTGPRKRGEPLLSVQACLGSAVQLPDN